MKRIFENLKYLKLGTSTSDYPIYSQLIFSKDGNLYTCNGTEMVCIYDSDLDLGDGAINFHVLENYLKMYEGEIDNCELKDDKLIIRKGNLKTDLNVSHINLPKIEVGDVDTVSITEEVLTILKNSLNFVGSGILEHVYLDDKCICATDGARVMFTEHSDYFGQPVGISKKILSVLNVGDKIGVKDHNVVIYFKSGFAIFTADKMESYPIKKIKDFVSTSFSNTLELCNLSNLREAFLIVEPVLFRETKRLVAMSHKNKLLSIKASSINGEAETKIETVFDKEFQLTFDITMIRGVDTDYDVLISDVADKLLLTNNLKTNIILMAYTNR